MANPDSIGSGVVVNLEILPGACFGHLECLDWSWCRVVLLMMRALFCWPALC